MKSNIKDSKLFLLNVKRWRINMKFKASNSMYDQHVKVVLLRDMKELNQGF